MTAELPRTAHAILAIFMAVLLGIAVGDGNILVALWCEAWVIWNYAFVIFYCTIWKERPHRRNR